MARKRKEESQKWNLEIHIGKTQEINKERLPKKQ